MVKLENMEQIGKIVGNILKKLKENIKENVCGQDLNKIAEILMKENNAYSSSLGYNDFPASICVSVSNKEKSELTHGIPTFIPFKKGDLVSIDVACYQKNKNVCFHADAALTVIVGETENEKKNKLINVTKNCLNFVINQIKPNVTNLQDIGEIIQKYVESRGFHVIKEFGGHFIGEKLHELPCIPNYKIKEKGKVLKPGMFICIEPLVQELDNQITLQKIFLENNKI